MFERDVPGCIDRVALVGMILALAWLTYRLLS